MVEKKFDIKNKKLNCWEYNQCGREVGGKNVKTDGVCPVSTDELFDGIHNGRCGGRICWEARKYHSNSCIIFAELGDCEKCDFYHYVQEGLANERGRNNERLLQNFPQMFQYLSKISENLVSPISIMKLNLAFMIRQPGSQQIMANREMVNSMLEISSFMEDILQDIQDISLIGSREIDLDLKVMNYYEFFQKVLLPYRNLYKDKGMNIQLFSDCNENLYMDEAKLTRALKILFDYILKALRVGSPVEFRIIKKDPFLMTHLLCKAPVEEIKIHPAMFDDFYETCGKLTGREKNEFLRIAVAQQIIRAHGGIINSRNLQGKGALITFTLPIRFV